MRRTTINDYKICKNQREKRYQRISHISSVSVVHSISHMNMAIRRTYDVKLTIPARTLVVICGLKTDRVVWGEGDL